MGCSVRRVCRGTLALSLFAALGCTETTYHVTVDDPAVVRVVPHPPRTTLETTADGTTVLRYRDASETRVTPIVDARGHLAPYTRGLPPYDIDFPIGQVTLTECARHVHRGCAEGALFEIVSPLDHVREIRSVTRFEPFVAGWLVFAGALAGVGAGSAAESSSWNDGARIGVGIGLASVASALVGVGLYLLFSPPRTKVLFASP